MQSIFHHFKRALYHAKNKFFLEGESPTLILKEVACLKLFPTSVSDFENLFNFKKCWSLPLLIKSQKIVIVTLKYFKIEASTKSGSKKSEASESVRLFSLTQLITLSVVEVILKLRRWDTESLICSRF